jgi:tetratricopeptide (TPR) repeat protein
MARPLGKRHARDVRAQILQALQLETQNHLAEADRLYAGILESDPTNFYALYRRAILCAGRGDDIEALRLIQAAMKRSVTVEVLGDCAVILDRLGRSAEAMETYDRALILDPGNVLALLHRGRLFTRLGQHAKAAATLEKLLARSPDHADAHESLGHALVQLGRHRDAIASFERAVALAPDNANAHFNLALALLLLGDFEAGWAEYEWRFRTEGLKASRSIYPQPHWDGVEPLAGKTIQVYTEQGLGDSIMFVRYAPMLAAQGATVIAGLLPQAKVLMTEMSGVVPLAPGDPLPAFDIQAPLLSLPYLLKTRIDTIPADVPYIRPRADRVATWRDRLPRGKKLTAGVVWAGGKDFKGDHNRSIALQRFETLFDAAGIGFVSLQRELRAGDAARLRQWPDVVHVGEQLADFADTAAIISMLDLVISVDTSVAHLAGAMARPVWILLPMVPDFRWLLDRTDSPWYPTARLFRQSKLGDWDSVLANVKAALSALV